MENAKERLRNFLKFFDDNKIVIAIGFAVVLAIGVPVYLYKQKATENFDQVWSRIYQINYEVATARQSGSEKQNEAIEGAIREYTFLKDNLSTTGATPWLLLELGNSQYKVKKYDDAMLTYREFIERFGDHSLVPIVRQSLGYVLEEKEQFNEAVGQFEKIAKDPEATYLKAQAKLDAGRCYEKLKQINAAMSAYKDVIDSFPDSGWAKMAKYQLEDIE